MNVEANFPSTSSGHGRNWAFGIGSMLVGSTLVLGSVVAMNEFSEAPERHQVESGTVIEVKKAPKPKPKQQVKRPPPKPKSKPKSPPPPSLAALTSGLGGIAVDIPALAFQDLGAGGTGLLSGGDDVAHTSDTVDTPPQPVQQESPSYPQRLRDQGIEGFVTMSVLVNATGGVERVKIIESKPPGAFDDVAKQAIQGWRFQPGTYEGEAVKVWVRQTVRFELRR